MYFPDAGEFSSLHPEVLAEIDASHGFVTDDLLRAPGGEHNALADAQHNRLMFDFLRRYEEGR